MKSAPTEHHRAIAQRRLEGHTLSAVAAEFETNVERVRQITKRVEDYDRGAAMLREDPANIEALELMGRLPAHARLTLRAHGIDRLTDLAGIPMSEMLRWPNFGPKSAALLIEMLERYQQQHRSTSEKIRTRKALARSMKNPFYHAPIHAFT